MKKKRTFLGWFSVKVKTCFLIISLTQEQEKGWTAHTHTHTHTHTLSRLVVGLNRFMRNA
jgi:hypothetical protein